MKRDIPTWVMRFLRQLGSVTATPLKDDCVALWVAQGKKHRFAVKLYPSLSQERAQEVVRDWNGHSLRDPPLLAVRELAPRTRETLKQAGLSWMESDTGVCHIVAPGILIDTQVKEAQPAEKTPFPAKLRDHSGLIAEALLNGCREIRVASMAKLTHVSPALVSRVFKRLTRLQIIEEQGAGPNRSWSLKEFGALLELWSKEERPVERVTELYVWARSPQALYEKLPALNDLKAQWAVAGQAAAHLYSPILTAPPNPIIRLDAAMPAQDAAKVLGGEVVETGANLQVWQTPGNLALHKIELLLKPNSTGDPARPGSLQIISRPRAYVETAGAPGRAAEVAQSLRERMMKDYGRERSVEPLHSGSPEGL
jgi:hypothetical protein